MRTQAELDEIRDRVVARAKAAGGAAHPGTVEQDSEGRIVLARWRFVNIPFDLDLLVPNESNESKEGNG